MDKAGLYIHVPFCRRKCNYCDFYSIKVFSTAIENFIEALCREIELASRHPFFSQIEFNSIFFGGGTPSLLSPLQLNRIVEQLPKYFHFSSDLEFTLEANPESLTLEKLKAYRAIGVNRISIGIQSFSDSELETLSRCHQVQQAINSVNWANKAGFENISLDLIFAIPNQTKEQWEKNLLRAVELNPTHLSAYGLTVVPSTSLAQLINSGIEKAIDEETERQMYLSTIEILSSFNYGQYEISNFARQGYECRHNLGYWDFSPYLGLGPSAHSYWGNCRQWNVGHLKKYIELLESNQLPIEETEVISIDQRKLEFIFLSLRKNSGLDLKKFAAQFGRSFWESYQQAIKKIERYAGEKLFSVEDNFFKLTAEGFVLYNEICRFFA